MAHAVSAADAGKKAKSKDVKVILTDEQKQVCQSPPLIMHLAYVCLRVCCSASNCLSGRVTIELCCVRHCDCDVVILLLYHAGYPGSI
jgi:hypothetical protein